MQVGLPRAVPPTAGEPLGPQEESAQEIRIHPRVQFSFPPPIEFEPLPGEFEDEERSDPTEFVAVSWSGSDTPERIAIQNMHNNSTPSIAAALRGVAVAETPACCR